jgi:hypothetical protein
MVRATYLNECWTPAESVLTFAYLFRSVASEGNTLAAKHNPAHKAMVLHEHIKVSLDLPPERTRVYSSFLLPAGLPIRHLIYRACDPARHCRHFWPVPRSRH